jgi:hypothetical protein
MEADLTAIEDSALWYAYSATLRIFGDIQDLDEITQHLGVVPTDAHRKNELRGPDSPMYKHDMWSYEALVDMSEPLHVHIDALWNTFKEHKQYLLQLKRNVTVDVFLGYRVPRVSQQLRPLWNRSALSKPADIQGIAGTLRTFNHRSAEQTRPLHAYSQLLENGAGIVGTWPQPGLQPAARARTIPVQR